MRLSSSGELEMKPHGAAESLEIQHPQGQRRNTNELGTLTMTGAGTGMDAFKVKLPNA
jgi:hypothetical protein